MNTWHERRLRHASAKEVAKKFAVLSGIVGQVSAMGAHDDRAPMTLRRALRAPEFWLLVVASIAATVGVRWWVTVPLVVAGLSIASIPKFVALWPRAREVGAELEWWKTIAMSMFNNLGCACGVQMVGVFARCSDEFQRPGIDGPVRGTPTEGWSRVVYR
jgi:hypothetical protein